MSRTQLRASLRLWRARETYRKDRHTHWDRLAQKGVQGAAERREHWSKLLREARAMVERREKQLKDISRPRVISAAAIDLHFQDVFGGLGQEWFVTGHHTAGPKDKSLADAVRLCRQYHRDHKAKGWGGIGYFVCICRGGEIICLRPTNLKGAHVGGHNSNNVGVMFHGTTGDQPTDAQRRSYRYWLDYAHTSRFPKAHRTDNRLRGLQRLGHNDWSGHGSNACPGTHKSMIKAGG